MREQGIKPEYFIRTWISRYYWNHHNCKPPSDGQFGGGEINALAPSDVRRTISTVPNNCSME